MKLDQVYINEAIRIRKEYIRSLKNIVKEEDTLLENKNKVENIKNNMENVVDDSDMNDITKRLKLNNDLIKIEKIIKDIQSKVKPHYDKIENLRMDADKLYNSIKEKYPNITENEIKKQISPYLQFK